MNHGWTYRDRIRKKDSGKTVLAYYSTYYSHSSRDEWRDRIEQGQISLANQPTTPDTVLEAGQKLSYQRPPWQEPTVPLNFEVLHQDSDLLMINKPSGLPVLPGGKFLQHTLWGQLQQHFPQDTPVPIHRLGRGTSGLMLLARSQKAKSALSQQMRDRQIQKIYLAKASGKITQDEFRIDNPIGKIPHNALGYIYGATPGGKYAISDCQVVKHGANFTIVKVNILTGRPHQIRIHLAAVGHPLVGDPLYVVGGIPRQYDEKTEKLVTPSDLGYLLHAHYLEFQHPTTHKMISFTCEPPPELTDPSLVERL